jgi:hypothetical protein
MCTCILGLVSFITYQAFGDCLSIGIPIKRQHASFTIQEQALKQARCPTCVQGFSGMATLRPMTSEVLTLAELLDARKYNLEVGLYKRCTHWMVPAAVRVRLRGHLRHPLRIKP